MKRLLFLLLIPAAVAAQKPAEQIKKINPKLTAQAGFCIPEFYNLGYELNANYYPFSKNWVRLGPAIQMNNFYVVQKEWFKTNNQEKSTSAELRFNALFNVEFIPFKKNSFYVGLAPYIGFQTLSNKGRLTNEAIDMDVKWKYTINTFDYGTRVKLGGYLGKKKRCGIETVLQMSNRGIGNKNPLSKFFNVGLPTYKSYVALNFVYIIL
jgi:hypothetical protein